MTLVRGLRLNTVFDKFLAGQMNSKTILIEGNIGAGKSTLIQYLKKTCPDQVLSFAEPVDSWRDAHGANLFELMYKNATRWTFAFQCFTNLSRYSLFNQFKECESNARIKIVERSLFSAQYCFVENSYAMNLITDVEYCVLKEWFDFFTKNVEIDYVIYLRSDPKTCLERINLRSRPEEKGSISLEYLQNIHDFHDKWLIDKAGSEKRKNIKEVIVVDASQNLSKLYSTYDYLTERLTVDEDKAIKENSRPDVHFDSH